LIQSEIKDGGGTDRSATVTTHNALEVALEIPDVPEIGTKNRLQFNTVYLGSEGGDAGAINMAVDGSVTPQEFYYSSQQDYDVLIDRFIIVLVDGSVAYNKFGAVAALPNGFRLSVIEANQETVIIDDASTTGELVALTGAISEHDILGNYNAGNDDAFILNYSINGPLSNGLRIGRGTQDRIVATVKDDLTELVTFNIRAVGARHYP